MSKTNTRKAKVKATGKEICVYKLKSGGWNIFLGDEISLPKVANNEHTQQFKDDELEFLD